MATDTTVNSITVLVSLSLLPVTSITYVFLELLVLSITAQYARIIIRSKLLYFDIVLFQTRFGFICLLKELLACFLMLAVLSVLGVLS